MKDKKECKQCVENKPCNDCFAKSSSAEVRNSLGNAGSSMRGFAELNLASLEEMYVKMKPLVEKMKAKYPKDCNIEGLEPALTNDIAEIVLQAVAEYKAELDEELVKEIINELTSNPNEDGSQSPNIQHFIEKKQSQIRRKFIQKK